VFFFGFAILLVGTLFLMCGYTLAVQSKTCSSNLGTAGTSGVFCPKYDRGVPEML